MDRGEAGACLQQSMGERRGTSWTGRQSIAGQHRHTQDKQPHTHSFTPEGNVERLINLIVMFLDCGRKPEYPERTHACRGEHANSLQKDISKLLKTRQCFAKIINNLKSNKMMTHHLMIKYFLELLIPKLEIK
ncbi:hypothetical protein ILYODFUR_008574 [Ilyodon furcidens]|uniref:Uncharacterized protein n=1 Tax=Ilyodon furcidens TaxID=33524 RepID=A0ABV0T824_9TELE